MTSGSAVKLKEGDTFPEECKDAKNSCDPDSFEGEIRLSNAKYDQKHETPLLRTFKSVTSYNNFIGDLEKNEQWISVDKDGKIEAAKPGFFKRLIFWRIY